MFVLMFWLTILIWAFNALAPRGWKDTAAKVLIILSAIVGTQLLFTSTYLGNLPETYGYYVLSSVVVGGPWVLLFFSITTYQIGLQRKLSLLSRKDGLTGLNNRRTFLEMTNRRNGSKSGGVLMMIDADDFKKINDTHGHAAGDECLKAIAYRVGRNTRETDVAGRLGGEEFAIFLAGANLAQARTIASRLLTPIPYNSPVGAQNLTVTLSIGCVQAKSKNTLDQLLIRADDALYLAKKSGKAKMVIWTKELVAQLHENQTRAA